MNLQRLTIIMLAGLAGALAITTLAHAASTPPAVLVVSKKAGAKYATIQCAIDAAPDGATLRIDSGDYVESLSINKPLTLEGAGWQQTTITVPNDKAADIAQAEMDAEKRVRAGSSKREVLVALAELEQKFAVPCIAVDGAAGVSLRELKITSRPSVYPRGREIGGMELIRVKDSKVTIDDCAVVGSLGDGIVMGEGADGTIENCLIAAAWGTGIAIGARQGAPAKVHVIGCDVRNCYYAGITSGLSQTTIERCRISGAAWHGIRYGDSPIVKNNIIRCNTRCGIYADANKDGATIEGNLFYRNQWDGIACWDLNVDRVRNNIFAFNGREALAALGGARPVVAHNVFYANETAIHVGAVNGNRPSNKLIGDPALDGNLFWKNQQMKVEPAPNGKTPPTRTASSSIRNTPIPQRVISPRRGIHRPANPEPASTQASSRPSPAPGRSPKRRRRSSLMDRSVITTSGSTRDNHGCPALGCNALVIQNLWPG